MFTHQETGSNANSYAILAKLATGGMAEIYLARTESSANVERYVVLKRVHRHRSTDIKFVNMFLDEARLAAQLQHPNIAQVYDTGRIGDSYFFTMEYVHGETVRELLHRAYAAGVQVPIGCVLTIVAGAAAGLQHAHDRVGVDGKPLGIVHRDVSPSNLMVTYDGGVKVVDFGVAKASDRSTETQSGTIKGKIGYMSPEQCRGGEVDRRCDLFSLGIVMWELLVGERLWKRNTDFESMEAVIKDPAPPPSSKRPELAPELDAIVLKLLEKHPADRYQSADELLEDIEGVAVRMGTGISVAALRRFVRELFGQRPEPWLELRAQSLHPEVVTVTGAPVIKPDSEAFPSDDPLSRLVDLSVPETPEPTGSRSAVETVSSPRPVFTAPARGSQKVAAIGWAGDADDDALVPVRPRRGWLVLAILAVLAGGAAVAFVATRGEDEPERAPVATTDEVRDAAATAIEPDARDVATAPPDAAAEAPPIDAAPTVDPATPDAIVARCLLDATLAEREAPACVLAACKTADDTHAKRWLVHVTAAERPGVLAQCRAAGVPLDGKRPVRPVRPTRPKDPTPKDPCVVDPMSCRR